MRIDKVGDLVQSRIETGGFTRLHEAEMAFRQADFSSRGKTPRTGIPMSDGT
jgi:hypothetical protein